MESAVSRSGAAAVEDNTPSSGEAERIAELERMIQRVTMQLEISKKGIACWMERRAETASGDEAAPGKLSGGGHLCSGGLGAQHVLPSAAGAERRGAARGIVKAGNRLPDLRLSPPDGTAGTTGLAGESQAGAAGHAGMGLTTSGEKAENPHYQQRPFLPALPEPCRRCRSQTPRRYLGGGHHLRALGTRLRVIWRSLWMCSLGRCAVGI